MIPRSPGAVGSLALAVFHGWNLERLFVIITVFVDESGTHSGSPIMILGGIIARLGQWVDFDGKWKRLLKRESLEYFHGTEFRSRRGQFAGWSDLKCDAFLTKAQKIVGRHTLCGFVTTMNHDDYKNIYRATQRPQKVKIDSKYGLCFRISLLHLPRLIGRSLPKGDHQVNFVLESGDPGSGDAKPIFDDAKKRASEELAGILGTLTYGDKKGFPGLQGADLIAFAAFRAEQVGPVQLISLPKDHTIDDSAKQVSYKSPVIKWEITPAMMNEIVAKGISEVEERRRFWKEGRKNT